MDTGQYNDEFVKLLDKHKGILLYFCMIYTDRSSDGIENLYQEIVYQLLRGYPRFRGGSQIGTWVYRTALNTARQQWRWQRRQPQTVLLDPELCNCLADAGSDPRVSQMYELIDRLHSEEKQVMALYLAGLKTKEMAEILSLTESVVRQRIHRTITKLKKMYETENAK